MCTSANKPLALCTLISDTADLAQHIKHLSEILRESHDFCDHHYETDHQIDRNTEHKNFEFQQQGFTDILIIMLLKSHRFC